LSRQELADLVNEYLFRHAVKARWSPGRRPGPDARAVTRPNSACIDAVYVGKLERGVIRWPALVVRAAFRNVLGAATDAELGFYIVRGLARSSEFVRDGIDEVEPTHIDPSPVSAGDASAPGWFGTSEITETGDVERRELLRLLTTTGAFVGVPLPVGSVDWERIAAVADWSRPLDAETLDQHRMLNASLWRSFGSSEYKATASPLVHRQLTIIVQALRHPQHPDVRRRLCAVVADLLQLAGELAFDADRYVEAAQCYSLAATASREADAFDLWACAMTRHAYVSLYDGAFAAAEPMLAAAARLASHGDTSLSTRHWVQSVRAQALAGLGRFDECERALDAAEEVHHLRGTVHNGGWLRFDGTRMAEERGTCYVTLNRPDRAQGALEKALGTHLSIRRRGAVLTDLAVVGARRKDVHQIMLYGAAALDSERQSRSGMLRRKLRGLQHEMAPFTGDRHVGHLNDQITAAIGGR
jgi:hypothetical protein